MAVIRFRRRPVEVEAVQFTGGNADEVAAFVGDVAQFGRETCPGFKRLDREDADAYVYDVSCEKWTIVYPGQWVIKGVKGEFYPIAADVLAETYEPLHGPEVTAHPAYPQWYATGERIRSELGAGNANHASWIPHPFAGEGLPVCAACEQSERSEVHRHDCAESGCGVPAVPVEGLDDEEQAPPITSG